MALVSGPTTMTTVIPSYLYEQYQDDADLPAFIQAYNQIAQDYIDTLNSLNLPIYPNPNISGSLLDWVASGLYGMARPTLFSYKTVTVGDFNTYEFNTMEFNSIKHLYPGNVIATTDDIFKRILTWHLLKGDGKYFGIRWLKRRVMRFLIGVDGSNPNIDQTYQVSVLFGSDNHVTIRIVNQWVNVIQSAAFNAFEFNSTQFNALVETVTPLPPLPSQYVLQNAVDSNALELPFQFTWSVQIG